MKRLTKRYPNGNITLDGEINNSEPIAAAVKRLAEYEDADEKGLLVHLPCKVGDTVYIADNWKHEVSEFRINKIGIFVGGKMFYYQQDFEQPITPDLWDKTVFLTPEAAQQALKAGNDVC